LRCTAPCQSPSLVSPPAGPTPRQSWPRRTPTPETAPVPNRVIRQGIRRIFSPSRSIGFLITIYGKSCVWNINPVSENNFRVLPNQNKCWLKRRGCAQKHNRRHLRVRFISEHLITHSGFYRLYSTLKSISTLRGSRGQRRVRI